MTTPVGPTVRIDGRRLTLDEAALCQPMAIALHAASRAGEVVGKAVLVQGVGGIGTFLVCALVEAGAHVVASDVNPDRLALAKQLGARTTFLPRRQLGNAKTAADPLEGWELPVIFEVSGTTGGLKDAIDMAPRGCRIVPVGIQKTPLEIDFARITIDEKVLIGTNALVRENDFPHAVDLIARRHGQWATIAPKSFLWSSSSPWDYVLQAITCRFRSRS